MKGDPLGAETFVPFDSDETTASFRFLFIPDPNVNGVARLLLQGIDPHFAPSRREIVEITVLPVNDPPFFIDGETNATKGVYQNSNKDQWTIVAQVGDVDFLFLEEVNITYCLRKAGTGTGNNGNGNGNENGNGDNNDDAPPNGWFVLPPSSAAGGDPPCVLTNNALCITCEDMIEDINGWLEAGIVLVFNETVAGDISVELNVNDLGNIDYRPNQDLNTSVWLNGSIDADALVAATKPAGSNIALIAAPIAGLLAGALIAGLIFAIRKNQAKAAVENYFDRFALGMEGATNTSPLYEGATKGGESPIYQGST